MLLNVDSQTLVNGLLSATICPVVDLYIFVAATIIYCILIMLENYVTLMRTGKSNTKILMQKKIY